MPDQHAARSHGSFRPPAYYVISRGLTTVRPPPVSATCNLGYKKWPRNEAVCSASDAGRRRWKRGAKL